MPPSPPAPGSFAQPCDEEHVVEERDEEAGLTRVLCARSGLAVGTVIEDVTSPTGRRCVGPLGPSPRTGITPRSGTPSPPPSLPALGLSAQYLSCVPDWPARGFRPRYIITSAYLEFHPLGKALPVRCQPENYWGSEGQYRAWQFSD